MNMSGPGTHSSPVPIAASAKPFAEARGSLRQGQDGLCGEQRDPSSIKNRS